MSEIICRKGVTCDWKNAPLKAEDWKRLDDMFEEKLGKCSMAQPMRKYIDLEKGPKLKPAPEGAMEIKVTAKKNAYFYARVVASFLQGVEAKPAEGDKEAVEAKSP